MHFPSLRKLSLLLSGGALFIFLLYRLSPLTAPLPPYSGLYEVGFLDLEVPVQNPRTIYPGVTIKEKGQKGFELTTLAVTLYYPTSHTPTHPVQTTPDAAHTEARHWLPRPISVIGEGYARLLNIKFPPFQWPFSFFLWLLAGHSTIPGHVDAPVLPLALEKPLLVDQSGDSKFAPVKGGTHDTSDSALEGEGAEEVSKHGGDEGESALPCIVFSHGMSGMSQSYSHYLGSLASRGFVVAAVEHRDGSGPGSVVHEVNGKRRKVWTIRLGDVEHDPPMTELDLKRAQLLFREAEINETITLFQRLTSGEGSQIQNLKPHRRDRSLSSFTKRLNTSAITMIGHSYGATGALQAVKSTPENPPLMNGVIALDPGKESGPLNPEIAVPAAVFQSEEWTTKQVEFYGQGLHFDVVRRLVKGLDMGWFLTLHGTAHPSITDAPLIVPWLMRTVLGTTLDSRTALKEYIDVSVEFLNFLRSGERKGVLSSGVTSQDGPLGERDADGVVKGRNGGEWGVHVVPKEEEGEEREGDGEREKREIEDGEGHAL